MQENYAQAEAEATQAIVKCDESEKRYYKTCGTFENQKGFFRLTDECRALSYYYRGGSLMKQGKLGCARSDLERAAEHAIEANRSDIEVKSERLLDHVKKLIKKNRPGGFPAVSSLGISGKDGRLF